MFAARMELLKKTQEKFDPEVSHLVGIIGEKITGSVLQENCRKLKCKYKIYESLRIPKTDGQGKYEIDFLVVSEEGILGIEVKHWGGVLDKKGSHWQQNKKDDVRMFHDPVPLLRDKMDALRFWLMKRNILISHKKFQCCLVLSNDRVTVGKELFQQASVIKLKDLKENLNRVCGRRKTFFGRKSHSKLAFKKITELLDCLPTWDRLTMYGGKSSWGDITDLKLTALDGDKLGRSKIKSMHIIAFRNPIGLFIGPRALITSWEGKKRIIPLGENCHVSIRHAGSPNDDLIKLINLSDISLGWKDYSYY